MSEIKHTPTPWELSRSTGNAFPYVISYPGGDGNCLDYQWPEANVEFIVTAVNAYDKQRALIETLVKAMKSAPDELSRVPVWVRDVLAAALAAAKKEGF